MLTITACEKQKAVVYVDEAWNRDYAKSVCEMRQKNTGVACIDSPEQIATGLKLRFSSAVRQATACKNVTVNYGFVIKNLDEFKSGWSLSFNVGIDDGATDYSNSEWQIIDNKTQKKYGEGSLKDAVEAATRICVLATESGGVIP